MNVEVVFIQHSPFLVPCLPAGRQVHYSLLADIKQLRVIS